ncbi:hypothetical protein ACQB60_10890 [Actinomycetota bacterium Odt1-20B]
MRTTRLLAATSTVLLLSLGSAACGGSSDGDTPKDALTAKQTIAEYRHETSKLTLAPGWKWAPGSTFFKEKSEEDGAPIVYERGSGVSRAGGYWYCSWISRVVSSDLTEEQRSAALKKALGVRKTGYFKQAHPSTKSSINDALDKAELGDVSEVQQDFDLNCPSKSAG